MSAVDLSEYAERGLLKHRTFCLITGASKGYGRAMAITFATLLPDGSVLHLLSRNIEQLGSVKAEIMKIAPGIKVAINAIDLATAESETMARLMGEACSQLGVSPEHFGQAMVVHNAASLGNVTKLAADLDDKREVSAYFDLNLTSAIIFNSKFLKHFDATPRKLVINVTSICSLMPFKSWSLYCTAKAARDMMFRTMAEESPSLRVLSYAPGPIETDMQHEARTVTADPELKKMFVDMHKDGKVLSCDESISKLVKLLAEDTFTSGAHIDYYDIE